MPRSSRRRSSKHSSRDARDYSDSEDYTSSRDRKSRDESNDKVCKHSASREKRKLEEKDVNGNYKEEYSTSKRRRDRVDDGDDRWNGGDDDRREGTKKLKEKFSESQSRRRDENIGVSGESDEMVKKSSRKTEGKHRDSSSKKDGKGGGWERDKERERDREREREKEKGKERDRRGKEGKTEKLIDAEDLSTMKQASEKNELSEHMDSLPDRRIRKNRDDFSDGELNHDDLGNSNDRHFSPRGDANKDGRLKEEKPKDERYKDKYRESLNMDYRNRDDKQTYVCAGKDQINDKSDYKNSRDDKDNVDIRPKKHRPLDTDHDRDDDRDFDASVDKDRETYRREREQDRDRGRERDRKRDREWDRKRDRDRDRERERDRDRSIDDDVLPIDDRNGRYKDSKSRKRSLDDYDDYADTKSRDFKTDFLETEKRSLNGRIESDDDRGKSQPRQEHAGNNAGSDRKTSPNTTTLVAADECRQPKQEDTKYKYTVIEHRSSKSVSLGDVTGTPGALERNPKYRSSEKHYKLDEDNTEQLSIERSSTSKASPMGVMDMSPSTSLDRRYTNRTGVRRNLDIEESGRRSNASMGSRDDDRPNPEKTLTDDSTSVDSPIYYRTSQSNIPPPFRGGIGRGQGNAWRGGPNWTPPLPNGYIHLQHGPHHGSFPAMLPQLPSPLFGVRPSMEMNPSGIPYHISDAERFATRIGPLGWQTMHRWDGNNGVFRDEQNLYGGPDWDKSRHSLNSRGWDSFPDIWKGENGDVNLDISKEDVPSQAHVEDVSSGQGSQRSQKEGNRAKAADSTKTSSPETTLLNIAATPKSLEKENEPPYDAYLSRLDISAELADSELYDQIASLLNVKQSVTAEEDSTLLVNLKDGGRAVPKISSVLLSSLLFPATSDSVFQRAMGIYKKQRACLCCLPIIDAILGSKMEEEAPRNSNKTATEEPVLNHNEADSTDTEAEALTNVAVPEFSEVAPTKQPENKPEMGSIRSEIEVVTPHTAEEGENNMEVKTGKAETKGSNTLNNDDEKWGPLGSPSVILSRIHHSPESTH